MIMYICKYMIMIKLNIAEAKKNLSRYIERLVRGEKIVLCNRNKPIAEIVALDEDRVDPRPLGLARQQYGEFELDDAFFEPLPAEILDSFEGHSG